jgi:hypothetical protein
MGKIGLSLSKLRFWNTFNRYAQSNDWGIPASSTTKTGRHDIAEILLKVALNTNNKKNQSKGGNYSRVRTHDVLVIGLYELLGNPTT